MAPQVGSPRPALRYPRSFLGLLVIGLLLVALPLAAALLYSAWSTQHLAEQSRSAVYNAAQAARASRTLVNRIASLERLSLQMAVVPDADLLDDFVQLHDGFQQITAELGRLPLDARQLAALDRTVARERLLRRDQQDRAILDAEPQGVDRLVLGHDGLGEPDGDGSG